MARYRLSRLADADFEGIFEFGIDRFGLEQAVAYLSGLKERFEQLAEQPELYPQVDHIREGYRRSVYQSHSIYYRIELGGVLIVRILGHQNPDTAL